MQISNGVDIVKIERIEKSALNKLFLSRIYGRDELELYDKKGRRAEFLAGNFAAKEAFAKALGTAVRGFTHTEVEILRDDLGKPYFKLSGNAKNIAEERNLNFSVSISHEKEYAIAFVTAFNN